MSQIELRRHGSWEIKNIYCIGRNYVDHIEELNNERPEAPVLFLKSSESARGLAPAPMGFQESFSHELELVFLVKDKVRIGQKAQWSNIAGIGVGIDLTRRQCQTMLKEKGLPWSLAKSFAGAAILSEFLPLEDFTNLENISFFLEVNGELRQKGSSETMIWSPLELVTYLASMQNLVAGDLVFTGTPKGVGLITAGDKFRIGFLNPEISFDGQL